MTTYCIYKHTSPSGKAYIGQTKNYKTRTSKHKNCKSGSIAFANAIKKYTWDAFSHEILHDNLTIEHANELEEQLIKEHKTLSPNGYNLRTGGWYQNVCQSVSMTANPKNVTIYTSKPFEILEVGDYVYGNQSLTIPPIDANFTISNGGRFIQLSGNQIINVGLC